MSWFLFRWNFSRYFKWMFEVVIFTPKNIPSEVLPYKISVHWKIAPYSPVAISVENDEAVLFLCSVSPNWKYYLLYSVNSWIFPVQPVHDECFQKYYLYEKETIRVLDLVKTVFFFQIYSSSLCTPYFILSWNCGKVLYFPQLFYVA